MRASAAECRAGAEADNCEWLGAETLPSCVARGAVDSEIAAVTACPGSLAADQMRCHPLLTPAACAAVAGGACTWDAKQEACGATQLKAAAATPEKAAAIEKALATREPSVYGNCSQVKALFAIQDACNPATPPAKCRASPACAHDGSACVHTRAYLLRLAGAPATSPAFAAAAQCNAATTRDGCAAFGPRVLVSPPALAAIRAGDWQTAAAAAKGPAPAGPAPPLAPTAAAPASGAAVGLPFGLAGSVPLAVALLVVIHAV